MMAANEADKVRYDELVELARMCVYEGRVTTDKDLASEFQRMAREYQRRAAELDCGKMPDIGDVGEG